MRPKTAASAAVLALMLGTGAAMAQTTPSPSTNGAPSRQDTAPPAAQLPPEKMPAEKVMPSPKAAAPVDGAITAQATDTVLGTDLIGKTAYGADQKKIGTINDVIMKQDGSGVEGVVVGVGGFVAFFTGGLVAQAIGVILERTGSYASIFAAASLMYLLSLLILHLLVPRIGEKQAVKPA